MRGGGGGALPVTTPPLAGTKYSPLYSNSCTRARELGTVLCHASTLVADLQHLVKLWAYGFNVGVELLGVGGTGVKRERGDA